jgi:hypothetical protein
MVPTGQAGAMTAVQQIRDEVTTSPDASGSVTAVHGDRFPRRVGVAVTPFAVEGYGEDCVASLAITSRILEVDCE